MASTYSAFLQQGPLLKISRTHRVKGINQGDHERAGRLGPGCSQLAREAEKGKPGRRGFHRIGRNRSEGCDRGCRRAACTGDLPQPNRRMYDINTWFPGLGQYKETGSCSNCGDYQSRRLNTKVKINGENKFVHILNSTAVSDRPFLAILENFQTKDGSINIPTCLQPFTGFSQISPTL